ncbi:MAG: hypothetical protein HY754_05395 [Nitrospirae bacterium]|nr:hypothetical protein [Nitrospirota bacterium]
MFSEATIKEIEDVRAKYPTSRAAILPLILFFFLLGLPRSNSPCRRMGLDRRDKDSDRQSHLDIIRFRINILHSLDRG